MITQEMVRQALQFLHTSGGVFELCAIGPHKAKSPSWEGLAVGKKGVVAGWFNDFDRAIHHAVELNKIGFEGIYVTLNPCDSSLLARANNRLIAGVNRTKDNEILRLAHLLIDIDPVRPQGISSTEQEHKAALEFAQRVNDDLGKIGWPAPIWADSGNGAHLIYSLPDLQNTADNIGLIKNLLQSLLLQYAGKENGKVKPWVCFNEVRLSLDQKVFNPARLVKLYGTKVCKGENLAERPHRVAQILYIPKESRAIPIQILRSREGSIHDCSLKDTQCQDTTQASGICDGHLDVKAYLDHYDIEILGEKTQGTSILYLLKHCVFNPAHSPNEAAIGCSSEGKLFYQCFHESCHTHTWRDARKIISGDDSLAQFFPGSTNIKKSTIKESTVEQSRVNRFLSLPLPPFPIEALPHPYGSIVEELARAFVVPVEIPALALLSTAGACIGRTRGILIKSGWIEFANLFLAVVGTSGIGKSTATRVIYQPIFDQEKLWFTAYQAQYKNYETTLQQRKNTSKTEQAALPPVPDPPKCRQLIMDDATPEALSDAFEANPRGLLWTRDELSGLILDLDKYQGREGGTKSRLLSAYDSAAWKVSRINRKALIPHACLSIFGTIQPQCLPQIFSNLDAAIGFLPRFIFVFAEQKAPPLWSEVTASKKSIDDLTFLFTKLLNFNFNEKEQPMIIGVNSEAKSLFTSWFDDLTLEPWLDAEAEIYQAMIAKLKGQCLRIALILHCIQSVAQRCSEMENLDVSTMDKAIHLANYFKTHQKIAWRQVVNNQAPTILNPLQKRVLEAILQLEDSIMDGILFTDKIVERLNKHTVDNFKVDSRSVGRALNNLGFTTHKRNGYSCFNVSPNTFDKIRSHFLSKVPKLPALSINADLEKPEILPLDSPNTPSNAAREKRAFGGFSQSFVKPHKINLERNKGVEGVQSLEGCDYEEF